MENFPFKHLIWAIVVVIALFLFRKAWEPLILQLEEVTIFDKVKVKLKKAEIEELQEAERGYTKRISELESDLTKQEEDSKKLIAQVNNLKGQVSNCANAQATIDTISMNLSEFETVNHSILIRAQDIKNTHVLKKSLSARTLPQAAQ